MTGGASAALRFAARVLRDPPATIARWKALSGRKAVGCLGGAVPEEAVAAAGMHPVTLWGDESPGSVRTGIPLTRGVAGRGLAAAVRDGRLDAIDAWAMTVRPGDGRDAALAEALAGGGRPLFRFSFPGSAGPEAAADRLDAVEALIAWAGELAGRPVTDGALDKAVRAWNESRRLFSRLRGRMAQRPGLYRASDYVRLARSGMILPRPAHSELVRAVLSRRGKPAAADRPRVFLCGAAAPSDVVRSLDASGAALAGDDLAAGGRYYDGLAEESGDPALALARRYHEREAASRADDAADRLFERVRASGADRVLLLRAGDGGTDDRLLAAAARWGEERGIPCLTLDAGRLPEAGRGARARAVAAFLGGGNRTGEGIERAGRSR